MFPRHEADFKCFNASLTLGAQIKKKPPNICTLLQAGNSTFQNTLEAFFF